MKFLWTLVGVIAIATQGPPTGRAPSLPEVWRDRTLAREAAAALERGDWATALEKYGSLRGRRPAAAAIPYNMGVAAYRQGDLDAASRHFSDAVDLAGDPALKSRAAYNLGTTAYAQSLQAPSVGPDPNAALDDAMTSLSEALDHYRTTLKLNPTDEDARVNGELTQRRLDELQAMQDAMPQPSPDESESGDESSEPSQDGQQQGEQQQGDQQQGEQQQGEQQQGEQGEPASGQPDGRPAEQPSPSTPPEDQSGDAEGQPEPETPEDAGASEDQPTPSPADAEEGEPEPATGSPSSGMTRDEAERLLQSVRDKDRERNRARAAARASKLPPVDKDW